VDLVFEASVEIFGLSAVRSSRDGRFPSICRYCYQEHAYILEQQIRTIHFRCRFLIYLQLSLPYFYLPQFDITK
jgi:hypothetical protein